MYVDPAGQYQFELPLGWAYDPEKSHLITVTFRRWDRADEVVSVRAMPTFAPADASVERWHKALEERCFAPRMHPISPMQCGSKPAATADVHETGQEKVHRRFLIVRGTRLDVLVEHRTPEPSTGPRFSDALSAICRSMDVLSNRFAPVGVEQEKVEYQLEQARQALQREAWRDLFEAAGNAQQDAQSTYLHSIVEDTIFPEVPAIVSQIEALIYMAQAAGSLYHLRDAEHLALRALYTINHLQRLPAVRRQQMTNALGHQLQRVTDLQLAIIHDSAPDSVPSQAGTTLANPGFGLARARLSALVRMAQEIVGDQRLALRAYEIAIGDLLIVLSSPDELTQENLPAAFVQWLVDAGVTATAEQVRIAKKIVNREPSEMLRSALVHLSSLRALLGDVVGAAQANDFAETLARSLLLSPAQEEQHKWLAISLIQQAENLVAIEDAPSLKEAEKHLAEAEKILNGIQEESVIRAHLCLLQASILHSMRRVDNALETIDHGLRAAGAAGEDADKTVRELKTLKSQFLIHVGRLPEARELAAEIVALPEGESPRERLSHANYFLNLAIIDAHLNQHERAAESLAAALQRALAVNPFGEESYRILMAGSRLYTERAVGLSSTLNFAAAATLDVSRTRIASDAFRIGFDESTRRREAYEDLVGHYLSFDNKEEAVAAADRSRSQSLIELLAPPAPQASQIGASTALAPPSLVDGDVKQALRSGAEYVIEQAEWILRQRGAPPALTAHEVTAFAQEVGAAVLVIQRVHEQIALLLVQPSGEVEARFSPLSLEELLQLVDSVWQHFHIAPVTRGEAGEVAADETRGVRYRENPTAESERYKKTLLTLWQALIEPVREQLVEGEPLVIVPYREFTLVPYALLYDTQGIPLVELHALSVIPSLASLRALRRRGAWSRTRPARAYIAGNPALDANHALLGQLPAARSEAQALASILKEAGVGEQEIIVRLDEMAHEESYRRQAQGCDLVHLACHATVHEPAYRSCLYLAPQGHDDGLLLASEIPDVRLDDALVFLSACETGQGRIAADGIIGLGRAFLEAGARAVVLSLWKVQDDAAATLSTHFYRALLSSEKSQNAAEALREAMLATRADLEAGRIPTDRQAPLLPHPRYWAPFFVLGDALAVQYDL